MNRMNVFGGIALLGFGIAAVMAGREDAGNQARDSSPPIAQKAHKAPIAPNVYDPYQRGKGYEKTFQTWGHRGVDRIQKLREAAAETVSLNPKCDAVELSELSAGRSSPPDHPVVFVDCANMERFYLSESDTRTGVRSEMEKGATFSSASLVQKCTDAVRARLNIPASFDRSIWSVSDRQGTSGNRVVEFDFEAKNRLGGTLPASARCIMTTQGNFEVEIIE